ncbi:MAG: hypothetical protein ACOYD4_06900 [Solirubrobacterales bacterium]
MRALVPASDVGYSEPPYAIDAETWLTEGSAVIDRTLSAAGYVVPVEGSAVVYAEITALANLYGAAYALRARGLDTVVGETEARSDVWLREFRENLASLAASDLTGVGVSLRTVASPRQRRVHSLQLRRVDGYSGETIGVTD